MSGGFFRGTSAEQDTRFSNKQAKLLKSHKFAPELEHLVDTTKVKMDVMRPWIANRVTELIGFEDEVLINFIYGLLDGKAVNGKEVQISLTGFMERNTGKFMKELWVLLLSAQKNASGVPQQFLDAKEEETKKKKAETDRIANEIQRKREKESQELEQERNKKMDAGNDILKDIDAGMEPISKHQHRASGRRSVEEKESKERNGSRGRIRASISPQSADRSSSPRGMRSRSNSKSFSNSRSYSDERRSRSLSTSPRRRGRSSSSGRVRRSPPKRSLTPHRRHLPRHSLTPPRRRSSYSWRPRNRSPYPSRYRMRSPLHRGSRSPLRRRSRPPILRRSRSPIRRSPQTRSRSPVRHRSSSLRRRSLSPIRRRSPSPMRYISRSPARRHYRRSPSTPWHRSLSPIRRRSPVPSRRRSPTPVHRRSPSAQDWSSPSPVRHRSPSLIRRKSPRRQRRTPVQSTGERIRNRENQSPLRHASPGANGEHPADTRKRSLKRQSRSDSWERNDSHRKVKENSPSPRRPLVSEGERETSLSDERRPNDPSGSPLNRNGQKRTRSYSPSPPRKPRENKFRNDSSETNADDKETNCSREASKGKYESPIKNSRPSDQHNNSYGKSPFNDELSPDQRLSGHHPGRTQSNKKNEILQSGNKYGKMDHLKEPALQDTPMIKDVLLSDREKELPVGEGQRIVEKNQPHLNDIKITDRRSETLLTLSKEVKQKDGSGTGSEESDEIRAEVGEKRNNKMSERRGLDSDESSYDSYEEERKEAKRRRKEEKKLRKEERRRRREERRRKRKERHGKREERRAEKQKMKSVDTVSTPSDTEKYHDDRSDDDQCARRHKSRGSDAEENESEQKRLEIELREKALESLRAKKGIGH